MEKSKHLSLFIFMLLLSPTAFSVTKNLCDDLANSGSSEAQIQKCWDIYKKSDTALEKEKNDILKKDTAAKNELDKSNENSNIETKKFTESDLSDAGFGKDFFALKYNYKFKINGRPKESRITKGDSMCNYLGYEKALKSIVSTEMFGEDSFKKGLFVDTTFGFVSKEPELFSDESSSVSVRKYVEITCARRKDKNVDVNNDALKSVTEDLKILNEVFTSSNKDSQAPVNNEPRSNSAKEGGTDRGYKRPDWANDSATAPK